jgi:hypothetical protein
MNSCGFRGVTPRSLNFARTRLTADAVGFLARYPQLGDDAVELPALVRRAVRTGRDSFLMRRNFALHASTHVGEGNANLGEKTEVIVGIDLDILAIPIDEPR